MAQLCALTAEMGPRNSDVYCHTEPRWQVSPQKMVTAHLPWAVCPALETTRAHRNWPGPVTPCRPRSLSEGSQAHLGINTARRERGAGDTGCLGSFVPHGSEPLALQPPWWDTHLSPPCSPPRAPTWERPPLRCALSLARFGPGGGMCLSSLGDVSPISSSSPAARV